MLYHDNLMGMKKSGRRDWTNLALIPRSFLRAGKFPTYASFVSYMQTKSVGEQNVNPFSIRSVVVHDALWDYLAATQGVENKKAVFEMVGSNKELMRSVDTLVRKTGIPAPVGYDMLHTVDSLFIFWFVESFMKAVKDNMAYNATAYNNDSQVAIGAVSLSKIALGQRFSGFLEEDPIINAGLIDKWIKMLHTIIPNPTDRSLGIQRFKNEDFALTVASMKRVKATRSIFSDNAEQLLSESVDLTLTFSTAAKFPELVNMELLEFVHSLNPNNNVSIQAENLETVQVNLICEQNYLKPKDKSGSAFAEKLKRQREAQEKAHDSLLTVRCPRPEKKIHRTERLAWEFIAEKHADDIFMDVYRCSCGAWHIGHTSKKINRPAFLKKITEGTTR